MYVGRYNGVHTALQTVVGQVSTVLVGSLGILFFKSTTNLQQHKHPLFACPTPQYNKEEGRKEEELVLIGYQS